MTDAVLPRTHPPETARDNNGDPRASVSIVIPVYNEARNVVTLTYELNEVIDRAPYDYEIVWVDDGSTDDTPKRIDENAAAFRSHRALHLQRNFGQSAALAAGFDYSTGEIVVPMDGDGQNDPADVPHLVELCLADRWDCVSGNRCDRQDPLAKRLPSKLQTWLAKFTGPDIHDFGCTLKAYRREALESIDLYGEGHRYIPAKLYDRGFSVTEANVNHRPRENGSSHYGLGRLVRGFADLVFAAFWNRFSDRPFHLFGGAGFAIAGLGALVGLWIVGSFYLGDATLLGNLAKLLLSVGMVLFGSLLVIFGVLVEFMTKLYYRDEQPYRVETVVD